MQTFTRVEIKWIINTLNHAINAQEAIINRHLKYNTVELGLLKLQCDNDKSVREKIIYVLNNKDRLIEIV